MEKKNRKPTNMKKRERKKQEIVVRFSYSFTRTIKEANQNLRFNELVPFSLRLRNIAVRFSIFNIRRVHMF